MGVANSETARIRVIMVALSLIGFPVLVAMAFYSSKNLVPSLTKFQFTLPIKPASTAIVSQNTIERHGLNA